MDYHHPPWGFGLIAAIILVIPFYRICKRVGWNPWLGILACIPLVNLIFWYFLAFSDWPIQKSGATPAGGAGPTSP